jgi:hypothetical protein
MTFAGAQMFAAMWMPAFGLAMRMFARAWMLVATFAAVWTRMFALEPMCAATVVMVATAAMAIVAAAASNGAIRCTTDTGGTGCRITVG